ncbi:unnamed protein product [Prunus armeniaca]|uniref:Uncharacterized protein n=1 Tax=Prunus armeniaca TaxID=36596 RepID=A0A6J5Y332_PRUAR|nr:unnamed protein product [Prunus armeniaca]
MPFQLKLIGISAWVQNTPEPGEEGNSQPSQGVGQRLPGSPLEISSPGISGESLFRDSVEQPGGEPAPSEAAPPANPGGSREAVPPANPAGSQEAGPSNQGPAPYPYQPDQVIGGDSVETIKRRLLSGHEADLREGPWLERGARALDNPRGRSPSRGFSRYWTHSGRADASRRRSLS